MDLHPTFVLGIGMPSGFEWLVILVVMLLLFGKRLPEVMRGLGGSVREFKKGMDDGPAKPGDAPAAPKVDGAVSRDAAPAPTPPENKPH